MGAAYDVGATPRPATERNTMRYLCFVKTDEPQDQAPQVLMDAMGGAIEMRRMSDASPEAA
jgi:hypothetical protein